MYWCEQIYVIVFSNTCTFNIDFLTCIKMCCFTKILIVPVCIHQVDWHTFILRNSRGVKWFIRKTFKPKILPDKGLSWAVSYTTRCCCNKKERITSLEVKYVVTVLYIMGIHLYSTFLSYFLIATFLKLYLSTFLLTISVYNL